MSHNKENINECMECGNTFEAASERIKDFQEETSEQIYCPDCNHQKHFGVIHSE